MYTKYIVFNKEFAVIFDGNMTHAAFRYSDRSSEPWVTMHPTSAGFVEIYCDNGEINVACYGESMTLKLSSREGDSELVRQALGI